MKLFKILTLLTIALLSSCKSIHSRCSEPDVISYDYCVKEESHRRKVWSQAVRDAGHAMGDGSLKSADTYGEAAKRNIYPEKVKKCVEVRNKYNPYSTETYCE